MALIHCQFTSESLGSAASMHVILPQPRTRPIAKILPDPSPQQTGLQAWKVKEKYPTLFLLHGNAGDHASWIRNTSIERYVEKYGLAVVMPTASRSFYADMAYGYKYWTFISEELPALARSFFPLSEEREDTFAAGLSSGGYGALKLALTYPNRFAASASMSGPLDVVSLLERNPVEFNHRFGDLDKVEGSGNDLFHLVEQIPQTERPLPKLYQCCGTEDHLYEGNVRFREYCRSLDLDLTYDEGPGGHDWEYWDKQIQSVLKWLPLR